MTTSYTSKLKLALPATGDLDGTWGDVVNNNITSMIEEAIAGVATISSWTGASHTLTTADGTTSEARCAVLLLSGAPGSACEVITPATSKLYIVKNSVTGGYTATIKVSGQTGVAIPNGSTMLVYCNGTDIVDSLVAPVIDSPILTGTPIASTAALGDNSVQLATTAYAMTMQSPAFSGTPTAPTAAPGTNSTQIATTAFAQTMQSPAFTGVPTTPTAITGTNNTQIASTAFVQATVGAGVIGSASTIRETQVAIAAQTIFTLVNTYTPGTNAINVYINGVRQFPTAYTETDANTITMSAGLKAGDDVFFEIGVITSGTVQAASSIAFSPLTWNAATEVQTAIANVYPAMAGNTGEFLTTDGTVPSWASVYPTQTGNDGKFLQTNGTTTAWSFAGVSQVTTATTATTLTATPTLLKITPASYGVTVTLPDATTCSVGGPLHIIDNRGAYPVRVEDNSGVLKAFIFAGVVSHISLDDNSTAAGVWAIENGELVGASAQLLTTDITAVTACVAIDSSREYLQGYKANNRLYGVVYNRTTNTFGAVTLIRDANVFTENRAVLSATDQILVVSSNTGGTALEAVTLSISGTTITVNTAATATLSAAINVFADGCGLIAVGSSFVTSYTVATPAAQIRALSISGTTVTIGSATVLDGTEGGLIAASSDKVIGFSRATTNAYTKPYTVSGSTLSAGTGTTSALGFTPDRQKLATLPSGRWVLLVADGGSNGARGILTSLSGTTTTVSVSGALVGATAEYLDAIVVSSNKLLVLGAGTANNANILTDTAGTASAGTAITLDGGTVKSCIYASGTDVYVGSLATNIIVHKVDCSGASPVLTLSQTPGASNTQYSQSFGTATSNAVLSKSPQNLFGTNYVQSAHATAPTTNVGLPRLRGSNISVVPVSRIECAGANDTVTAYRGKAASEAWRSNGATVITKIEAAL